MIEQAIEEMARRIATQFDPDRIILFNPHPPPETGPA